MELSKISTSELVKELEKRESIKKITVEPYVPFEITVGGKSQPTEIDNIGCCLIYVVWD